MPNDSDNLRLGISALDLTHFSYAENDELMTRGTDGKMFYKRPDGNIVAYDSTEYNKDEIVSAIKNATNTSSAWSSPSEDYIAYYTFSMAGKNITTSTTIALTVPEIKAAANSNGIFIRLKPNNTASAVLAFIDTYRRSTSETLTDFATVTYSVTVNGTTTEKTAPVGIDKVAFIPFGNTEEANNTITIRITAINFANLKIAIDAIPYETLEDAKMANFSNAKLEIDRMDIITYVEDSSEIKLGTLPSSGFEFKYSFPVSIINDEYSVSDGIVISEDKPTYKCIWGKVISHVL